MPKKDYLTFGFDDIAFRAIAVHTALPPALFAWQADRILGTKFSLLATHFESIGKKNNSLHTQYYHQDAEFGTEWWLLENQGNTGSLLSVKPMPDMIFVGRGGEDDQIGEDWHKKIKEISGVSMAYNLGENEKQKMTWITILAGPSNTKN